MGARPQSSSSKGDKRQRGVSEREQASKESRANSQTPKRTLETGAACLLGLGLAKQNLGSREGCGCLEPEPLGLPPPSWSQTPSWGAGNEVAPTVSKLRLEDYRFLPELGPRFKVTKRSPVSPL